MSKYHKGDKFIVEIKEVIESDNGRLYRSDFKTLTFDDNGLDRLQKYEEEQIPYSEAYNKGLNDAWELAKKLWLPTSYGGKNSEEVIKIFGCDYYAISKLFTPQEALAKLEAYEKANEIKVGDVVKNGNGETEFVVIATSEETINGQPILRPIGKTLIKGVIFVSDTDLKKTGKYIDIQSILEQIKE